VDDLTLHEVDEDGAIREAFAAVSGNTRAEFLGKMVVGGSARAQPRPSRLRVGTWQS